MTFDEQVWKLLSRIPFGRVSTYKEIARVLGNSRAARAVGNACNRNSNAPKVPCHRVVSFDGSLGGYAKGAREKRRLLESEGVTIKYRKIVNFEDIIVRASELK